MTKSRSKKKVEDAIQRAVIFWCKETYPDVRILAMRNEDMRTRTGEFEAGHPDLHLECVHNNLAYILKLELKAKSGKLSTSQKKWNESFDNGPWASNVVRDIAYGRREAMKKIEAWLSLREA